jgi:hypothetical protein
VSVIGAGVAVDASVGSGAFSTLMAVTAWVKTSLDYQQVLRKDSMNYSGTFLVYARFGLRKL